MNSIFNINRVTASIVLYKTPRDQLARLLECISNSGLIDTTYLIDNSPDPQIGDMGDLITLPSIVYLNSSDNVGYGAGHNIALRKEINNSSFHFILNPDITFESIEIRKMLTRVNGDATVGQLMPKVLYPDGNLQYLCKLIPTPFDLIFRRFLPKFFTPFIKPRLEKFELRFTGYDQEMDIPYLSGCFMLLRVDALRHVGIFDERFFMYPEDIDLTRRIHMSYRTIFFPNATIFHHHARDSYKSKKMLIIHALNIIKYFNKWGWFFDSSRRKINKQVLSSLNYGK